MERFLFFNANEIAPGVYDREYVESDFADYFGSVLSTGLLHTDNIPGAKAAVEAGTLNTIVSPGKAIMKGHLYENTAPLTLTHSIPEATLDRIDRIVLRLDLRNQSRFIKLFVSEGIPASTPVAPVLKRDQFIHEISLAQVRVRKNTVQLLPSDLVDERLNEQLCGLAHSLISIPTDQLQAFITAKRTELNVEMNTALDSYLASLAAAESKLASDLVRWEQQWSDWFATIQGSAFVTGEEFATHKADMASQEVGKGSSLVGVHDAGNLFTSTTVEGALKEAITQANAAFTSASNGKSTIGVAITGVDPTIVIPPNPTFPQLATAIGQISTGKKWKSGSVYATTTYQTPVTMYWYNTNNSSSVGASLYVVPTLSLPVDFTPSLLIITNPDQYASWSMILLPGTDTVIFQNQRSASGSSLLASNYRKNISFFSSTALNNTLLKWTAYE